MAVIYYPKNQLMYIRDSTTSGSTYESVYLNVQPNTIIYFDTSSMMQGVNASLIPITASWAMTASVSQVIITVMTASWATQSLSSSYVAASNYNPYSTVITSSTYWITCSFLTASQVVLLATGSVTYAFTSSDHPTNGQYADVILYINNSFTGVNTASLSFPASWVNVSSTWPTSITGRKNAMLWLRAYDTNTVVGTYNRQG